MAGLKSSLSPTQRFIRLLKPDAREVRNLYVYALFHGLVYLSLPLGIQAIINLIQGGQVSTSWIILTVIVVIGIGLTGLLQIYQLRISENLQQKIFARAAFEFAYRLPKMRTEELYRHYAPELMNRFFDVLTVQKGLSKILVDFSVSSIQVVLGMILLSLYHPFFIAFGVILILLVLGIFSLTAKPGLDTSLKESKYKYKLAHWLEEVARTASTFKLAGKTDMSLNRTDRHVSDYLGAREKHFKIILRQYGLMVVFKVLVAFGLLAIGGYLVIQQRLNIGQFVAAEIIVLYVMSSVEKLVLSLETIYDVLTGLEKIGQVTDLELEQSTGIDLRTVPCTNGMEMEIDNVSFRYPEGKFDVLKDISMHIQKGERIALTGSNGSGKSSLLYIMASLYEPTRGAIAYSGIPQKDLQIESLHSSIGDCLTSGLLFEGTVLENIAMGREPATFERVQWAVEAVGLSDFIRTMSDGYHTVLDPLGEKLPRGVISRFLLARAIVDMPQLLLLEEALEHIDDADKSGLMDFLTSRDRPWTLVAVTRNPNFIELCDRAAIMEAGRVQLMAPCDDPIIKAQLRKSADA